MHKKETFGSVIYLAYNPILIFSLSENCCLRVIIIKDSWAFHQIKTRLGGILFLVKNKISLFFSSFKTFLVATIVFTKAIQCDGQIQQSSIWQAHKGKSSVHPLKLYLGYLDADKIWDSCGLPRGLMCGSPQGPREQTLRTKCSILGVFLALPTKTSFATPHYYQKYEVWA